MHTEGPNTSCSTFDRCGTECWFLTNEGNDPIDTELLLPIKCEIGSYDMWNGRAEKIVSESADEGRKLRLQLSVRESICYSHAQKKSMKNWTTL